MQSLAIIGRNISYTLSPDIYKKLAEESNIIIDYKIIDIDNLNKLNCALSIHNDLIGYNVTIPYKKEILNFLDYTSPEAKEIGAVNCVVIEKNGKSSGYNTDWLAFLNTFAKIKKHNHNKALILGSGGAAQAVVYALQKLKIDFLIVTRNLNNESKKISYNDLKEINFDEFNIIINTTPCGTMGTEFNLKNIFPFYMIKEKSLFYDLIYNPTITPFMQEGINRDCLVINGMPMLKQQAEIAWDKYFLPRLK